MYKISVIIPVYNTENYLNKCLDSLINQTLSEIEIICINDCSTDGSLDILKEYASRDKRIKLIDLPRNKGVANARNIGIDCSNGEYLGFLDSDDFVDKDFYKKLYQKGYEKNADAAKGNLYNYYAETNSSKLTDFYNMNDKIRENQSYFYYGFTSAIYKKSFINKHNIRFPESVRYFEDPYFSIKAGLKYKKLVFDDSAKYYYRIHEQNSSSNYVTIANFRDFHTVSSNIIEIINNEPISKNDYLIIINFLCNFIISNFSGKQIDSALKNYMLDIIVEILFASKFELDISFSIYKVILKNIAKGKYDDLLLKYYKKYDYINKNKNLIKILVSYIKPHFLYKSEILTPIHLGRAIEKESTKYGNISDEDIKWLHKFCIGDDNFEGNISYLNRRIGLFTGTYWAWKNYEKLGSPEYFGSFGYRRLFFPNFLNNIENYDCILPKKRFFLESLKTQIARWHGNLLYEAMIDAVKNIIPSEVDDVIAFFDGTSSHLLEMYVMKKELFFNYCNWIFNFIEFFVKKYPDKKLTTVNEIDKRDIAFIIERLSGYYFYKLTQNTKLKYKEVYLFEPDFILNKKFILSILRQNIKKDLENSKINEKEDSLAQKTSFSEDKEDANRRKSKISL